ncbi:MAG: type II toxin-antitoxin system RelE/ParE family toxin [Collinsella sp.]
MTRLLYFFFVGNRAIVTNGFVKETQRTPRKEIERAKRFREIWRSHNDRL